LFDVWIVGRQPASINEPRNEDFNNISVEVPLIIFPDFIREYVEIESRALLGA